MKNMINIFKREFKAYFVSPIAYIVISIFLLIVGWFFFSTFFLQGHVSLTKLFGLLPIMFTFIVPAVTMRLFSEELNVGSYELLLTLPVKNVDVIVGKFLASLAFLSVMLAPTLFYAISISFLGKLDIGPVIGGYLGAIVLGGSFSAIGIMASSITRDQVIAFIIGMAICFSLTFIVDYVLFFLPDSFVAFFQHLSARYHFENIAKGVLNSRDFIFFISVSFIALYITNMIMEKRK